MSYRGRFRRTVPTKSKSPPADISLDQHISASIDFADNAFTSKEINMPKMKEGYYPIIHDVEVEVSDLENLNANAAKFNIQLTDEEETDTLQLDDEDLIIKDTLELINYLGTNGSGILVQTPIHLTPKLPILYPHEKIYLGVKSSANGAVAGIAYVRIHYTVKQVSDFMVNMVMKKK